MSKILFLRLSVIVGSFLVCTFLAPMERPQSWQPNPKRMRTRLPLHPVMSDADKELLAASKLGDKERVLRALEAQANINIRDHEGLTPLFWAVAYENCELVRILLEKGAYREPVTKDGSTPLAKAAVGSHKSEEIVRLLLEYGAETDAAYSKGHATPLHLAAFYGNEAGARLLIDWDADLERLDSNKVTPLFDAASQGHLKIVKLLLDCGANVQWKPRESNDSDEDNGESSDDSHGEPENPLAVTARPDGLEHAEIIKLLMRRGCQLPGRVFYDAITNGKTVLLKILLESGAAHSEEVWTHNHTPLTLATENIQTAIVQLLLDKGADPNAIDGHGSCALQYLALARTGNQLNRALREVHSKEIAHLLMMYGALPTKKQIETMALEALCAAALVGDAESVKNELEKSPLCETKQQALAYAVGQGHPEVVKLLLQATADKSELLRIVELILKRTLALEFQARYKVVQTLLLKTYVKPLRERIISEFRRAFVRSNRFSELPRDLQERIASPDQQLLWAIHHWNTKRMREALNAGADVNVLDSYDHHHDNSVIALAVLYEFDCNDIELLLHYGADPNAKINGEQTLVEYAASRNNGDLVRLLILHGAPAGEQVIRTHLGGNLLPEAALGRLDVVRRLLAAQPVGLDFEEALLYAAGQCHVDTVDLLLEREIPTQKALEVVRAIRSRGLSGEIARRYYLIERMLTSVPEVATIQESKVSFSLLSDSPMND